VGYNTRMSWQDVVMVQKIIVLVRTAGPVQRLIHPDEKHPTYIELFHLDVYRECICSIRNVYTNI
jgi:hypothetical protein